MRPTFLLTCLLGLLTACAAGAAETKIDFNRDIRPILSSVCFDCHGPDAGQRKADLRFDTQEGAFADLGGHRAIVAGKVSESALVERIMATDEDTVMPPPEHRRQLSEAQKQLLVQWIEQGANWADHWSFIAPQRAAAPEVQNTQWSLNDIDRFILKRLEDPKIAPSQPADKVTLLRRLSFDLIGMAPTYEEVQAFVNDSSPKAYEAAVDRLLQSPHFGERMAMYWLDLVRYADTVGYHGDQNVSVSPYRDYVIDAFNDNMPFDRFTREQLAGDLLPEATVRQRVASGYNRLGMMSAEGGVQPKEYLAKYAADRVRTASAVWLGSTLGCAECHDHKYDPFTTKDFYRFAAFFADIKERGLYSGGDFGTKMDVPDKVLPNLLQDLDQQIAAVQKSLETPTPALAAEQAAWEAQLQQNGGYWQTFQVHEAKATGGTALKVQTDGSIIASGANPKESTYSITVSTALSKLSGLRLEVLPDPSLPKQGPGRAGNGNLVITEVQMRAEQPLKFTSASATIEQAGFVAASTINGKLQGNSEGWAILPQVSRPQALVLQLEQPIEASPDQRFTIVIEQKHANHNVGRFRLAGMFAETLPKPDVQPPVSTEIAAVLNVDPAERNTAQNEQLAKLFRSMAPSLDGQRKRLKTLQDERAATTKRHTRQTLVTVTVDPRPMRVLPRGNWMDDSGEVVSSGVPHFLPQLETTERATRLDLANWITAPDNPLTARVFVNRLWKLMFGTGLSKQLDDVGSQGEWPTHPELLDTLAVDFRENGWDVKRILKQIVMSQTYRQSSLPRAELVDIDPFNRLLARQSRFRLDAEMVRDNALSVSGLLVRKVGGRSVKPYQPVGLYRHLNFPRRTYQADKDENQYRRGVYTHWQRQFLHPAMKAFDAPAREECTAERSRSNTPLAALVLLNDPSYVEAARVFAESVLTSSKDKDARIQAMMQRTVSRPATANELQVLNELLTAHQTHFSANPDAAKQLIEVGLRPVANDLEPIELAAWTSVARTLFNLHEFISRN